MLDDRHGENVGVVSITADNVEIEGPTLVLLTRGSRVVAKIEIGDEISVREI
jgi:hypothetical protein